MQIFNYKLVSKASSCVFFKLCSPTSLSPLPVLLLSQPILQAPFPPPYIHLPKIGQDCDTKYDFHDKKLGFGIDFVI